MGDPALVAALLQQAAHFEDHLALSQGAIITGLIWAAIVASVIDGDFKNAGGFAAAAGCMAAIGVNHSASLHLPELSGITIGYFIVAAFLLLYPLTLKVERMDGEAAREPESRGGD